MKRGERAVWLLPAFLSQPVMFPLCLSVPRWLSGRVSGQILRVGIQGILNSSINCDTLEKSKYLVQVQGILITGINFTYFLELNTTHRIPHHTVLTLTFYPPHGPYLFLIFLLPQNRPPLSCLLTVSPSSNISYPPLAPLQGHM